MARRWGWLAWLVAWGLAAPVAVAESPKPVAAQVEDISDRAYLPAALAAIAGARHSIALALYKLDLPPQSPDHPVTQLVNALIAAHRRGVTVTILLDRDQAGAYPLFTDNDAALGMLQQAGLTPQVTPASVLLHAKLLIVDDALVLEGSHNWSYSALRENRESAVLIRSPDYARQKRAWLARLPAEAPPQFVVGAQDTILLSNAFLQEPRLMGRMLDHSDERAFDLALLVYRLHDEAGGQSPTLVVEADTLAAGLGLPETWDRTTRRRQLVKTLRKLAQRYQLLWVTTPFGKPYEITLRDLTDPTQPYTPPQTGYRRIPRVYWTDGWATTLSLRAKVAYLIAHRRAGQSPTSPWFQASLPFMASVFHIQDVKTLGLGFRELQRAEIVEIVQTKKREGAWFLGREPARYRLNGFPDRATQAAAWARLTAEHGARPLAQARTLADQLQGEPDDVQVVEGFLELFAQYGVKDVTEVTTQVAEFRPDYPWRALSTVRVRLQRRHVTPAGESRDR